MAFIGARSGRIGHETIGAGQANIALGAYETDVTENPIPENDPVWPEAPFTELLRLGFYKHGRYVTASSIP